MPRAAPPGSRASPSAATPVRRGMGKGKAVETPSLKLPLVGVKASLL